MGVTYATQGQVFTDLITNVASGGVFIQTSLPLSIGEELKLMLPFPSQEEPTTIMCEVVWRGPLGVGVQFTRANDGLVEMMESL